MVHASALKGSDAVAGNGGNITLTASGGILFDTQSRIDASSQLGIDGEIIFNAPIVALAEVVAPLPKNFVVPKSLFADRCAAQGVKVETGRFRAMPRPIGGS